MDHLLWLGLSHCTLLRVERGGDTVYFFLSSQALQRLISEKLYPFSDPFHPHLFPLILTFPYYHYPGSTVHSSSKQILRC